MHEAQQANLTVQRARQQRNQARQARGMMNRAEQPAMGLLSTARSGTRGCGATCYYASAPCSPTEPLSNGRDHMRAGSAHKAISHTTDHQWWFHEMWYLSGGVCILR
eukprot:7037955-Pyramimonas_sp.AAC.1